MAESSEKYSLEHCILVKKIPETAEWSTLLVSHFGSKKRSSGGEIIEDGIQKVGLDAVICFEDKEACQRVLNRGAHKIKGWNLNVYPCPHDIAKSCLGLKLEEDEEHKSGNSEMGDDDEDEFDQSDTDDETCKLVITGIPPLANNFAIEMVLENNDWSGGGPIKSFKRKNTTTAFVTFKDNADAESVLNRGTITISGTPCPVQQAAHQSPDDQEDKEILVAGVESNIDLETLEMYFESERRSGGGPLDLIEYIDQGKGLVKVIFKSGQVAQRVLTKKGHQLGETLLTVSKPVVWSTSTIKVEGFQPNVLKDTLEMYFESKRRSNGGPVEDIQMLPNEGYALVTFKDEAVAKQVVQKGNHVLGEKKMGVSLWQSEPEAPAKTITITGLNKNILKDSIEMFFESKKKCGGGNIENVEFNPTCTTAYLTYEEPEVAARVCAKEKYVLGGVNISVKLGLPAIEEKEDTVYQPKKRSIMKQDGTSASNLQRQQSQNEDELDNHSKHLSRTVIASGLQSDTDEDLIRLLFEGKKVGGGEVDSIVMYLEEGRAVVKFKDVQSARSVASKKQLQFLSGSVSVILLEDGIEPITETCAITVKGFDQSSNAEGKLTMYFDNRRMSGGEDVENVHIDKEGVAVITFRSADGVKRIIQKDKHKLEGKPLHVKALRPPPPVLEVSGPKENDKLIIKGFPLETKLDELMSYLQKYGKCTVEKLVFGLHQGTVMVYFQGPANYLHVRKICATKPLNGSVMSVHRLPLSCQLQVHGDIEEVEKMLQLYFDNDRPTGAGASGVKNIDIKTYHDNMYAVVTYEEHSAIETVMKKKHTLSGTPLQVSVFWEELGILPPDHDSTKPGIPIPSATTISTKDKLLSFLKDSKTQQSWMNSKLEGLHGKIDWTKCGKDTIQVDCTLNKGLPNVHTLAKTWRTSIEDEVTQLLKEYTVEEEHILQEVWNDVKTNLDFLKVEDKDEVATVVDDQSYIIYIFGKLEKCQYILERVQSISKEKISEKERKKQTLSETVDMTRPHMLILDACNFADELKKEFDKLKINFDTQNLKVLFQGVSTELLKAKLKMVQLTSTIVSQQVGLTPAVLGIAGNQNIQEYLSAKFKVQDVVAVLEVTNNEANVHAIDSNALTTAVKVVTSELVEKQVSLQEESKALLETAKWKKMVTQLTEGEDRKDMVEVITPDEQDPQSNEITIASISSLVGEVLEAIHNFINLNTIITRVYPKTNAKVRFLSQHMAEELRNIETSLHHMSVKINPIYNDVGKKSGFKISGTKDGVYQADHKLDEHLLKMVQYEHSVTKPGMPKYFREKRGKYYLETMENKHSVIIEQKGVYDNPVTEEEELELVPGHRSRRAGKQERTSVLDGKVKVAVIMADMTNLKVDAIVNAANKELKHIGGLALAILEAAGPRLKEECDEYVKQHGSLKIGDIMISNADNMACKKIIHAVGPLWNGGRRGEENALYDCVYNVLEAATVGGSTSIAIPAISSGIYGYPVEKATHTIVQAVHAYIEMENHSTINEVFLVDTSMRTINAFDSAMKAVYGTQDIAPTQRTQGKSQDTMTQRVSGQMHSPEEEGAMASTTYEVGGGFDQGEDQSLDYSSVPYTKTKISNQLRSTAGILVTLVTDEIAKEKVDVIVNTVATDFDLNAGAVSKSLLNAAGKQLQQECKKNAPDGIEVGQVVITSGGKLNCKEVFHICVPGWDSDDGKAPKVLEQILQQCMGMVDKKGYRSIAFPAIGTGGLQYPREFVASAMYNGVGKFCSQIPDSRLKTVHLVVYHKDKDTVKAFQTEMQNNSDRRKSVPSTKPRPSKMKVDSQSSAGTTKRFRRGREGSVSASPSSGTGRRVYGKVHLTGLGYLHMSIAGVAFEVQQGDLTKESTDAVVNSTNDQLDLTQGAVSQALVNNGGEVIAAECDQLGGTVDGIAVTGAGKLPCRHIIHLCAPDKAENWQPLIHKALEKAETLRCGSVAFPALGTGAIQGKPEQIAGIMFDAISSYCKANVFTYLRLIRVSIFQKDMVDAFKKTMEEKAQSVDDKPQRGYIGGLLDKVTGYFKKPQESDLVKIPEKSGVIITKSLTLVVHGQNNSTLNLVKQDIDRICDTESQVKFIRGQANHEIISKLSDTEFAQIKAIEDQYGGTVVITFEKSGPMHMSEIRLEGDSSDMVGAFEQIGSILRDHQMKEQKAITAKILGKQVKWEYSEDDGEWIEYTSDINALIEDANSTGKDTLLFKDQNWGNIVIDFNRNVEYISGQANSEIPIRRRDLQAEKGKAVQLPSTWDPMANDSIICKMVEIRKASPEYENVVTQFYRSSGYKYPIVKIERIQNPGLYERYEVHHLRMKKINPDQTANERLLWHGTQKETVENITNQGFNRAFCGLNAVYYGKGVYFAVSASYSCNDTYSKPDANGNKFIYLCKVLSGTHTDGEEGMLVPPPKDKNNPTILYDSVTDDEDNPQIFVIFSDTQAYPEYLITFKK